MMRRRRYITAGVLAVLALAAWIGAAWLWLDRSAADAVGERYRAAPLCTGTAGVDCRKQVAATVLLLSETSGARGTRLRTITVLLPDLTEAEVKEATGTDDLFPLLSSGTQVTAEVWQSQIVALSDGPGHISRTDAYPGVESRTLVVFALLLSVLGGLLLASALSVGRAGRRAGVPAAATEMPSATDT